MQEEKRKSPPEQPKMKVKSPTKKIHQWHREMVHGFSTISQESLGGKPHRAEQLTHRKHTTFLLIAAHESFGFLLSTETPPEGPRSSHSSMSRERTKGHSWAYGEKIQVTQRWLHQESDTFLLSDLKANHIKGFLVFDLIFFLSGKSIKCAPLCAFASKSIDYYSILMPSSLSLSFGKYASTALHNIKNYLFHFGFFPHFLF